MLARADFRGAFCMPNLCERFTSSFASAPLSLPCSVLCLLYGLLILGATSNANLGVGPDPGGGPGDPRGTGVSLACCEANPTPKIAE